MNICVIIVRGLNAPLWTKRFGLLVRYYYRYFDLHTTGNNWLGFKHYLEQKGVPVYAHDWADGISERSVKHAGARLAEFIETLSEDRIVVFGYSLGAVVAEYGIKALGNPGRIIKFISVSSPHKKSNLNLPKSIPVVNVYSDNDTYLDFANRMLYRGGFKEIEGAENVVLHELKHSQFNTADLYDTYFKMIITPSSLTPAEAAEYLK